MSDIKNTAASFFDACETGKGWQVCQKYCHPDATFGAQAGALQNVRTLEAYTEWMKGLFTPVPDGSYELRSFAVDTDRNNVAAYGVFRGTHTTHPKVTMLRASHILIESDPPLPVLIDGDVFGTTPAEFTLTPRAIEIMAP